MAEGSAPIRARARTLCSKIAARLLPPPGWLSSHPGGSLLGAQHPPGPLFSATITPALSILLYLPPLNYQ